MYNYVTIKHGVDAETKESPYEKRAITGQNTTRPDRSYFYTPAIRKLPFGFVDTQPALTKKRKK